MFFVEFYVTQWCCSRRCSRLLIVRPELYFVLLVCSKLTVISVAGFFVLFFQVAVLYFCSFGFFLLQYFPRCCTSLFVDYDLIAVLCICTCLHLMLCCSSTICCRTVHCLSGGRGVIRVAVLGCCGSILGCISSSQPRCSIQWCCCICIAC